MLYLLALFALTAALVGVRLLAADRQRLRRSARRRANLEHQHRWRRQIDAKAARDVGDAPVSEPKRIEGGAPIHFIETRPHRSGGLTRRLGHRAARPRG